MVGAVFAIIALATTVGYITYSMNVLSNYNQSVLARNQQAADIIKESFQINTVTYVNNELNITIANTGSLPINFTKIWITDKSVTTPPLWIKSYTPTRNNVVAPAGTLKNLGQDFTTTLNTNNPYHVKLVTSRGNIKEFDINSPANVGNGKILMKLYATPSKIPEGFTSDIVLTVTNNQTGNAYLVNVQPNSPVITKQGSVILAVNQMSIDPAPYPTLGPGQTATFVWNYMVSGSNGDQATFNVSLKNGNGQTVYDTVTIADVLNAQQSTSSLQSQGITCCRTSDNVLVLHQENTNTPSYSNVPAYQTYSGQVDANGLTTTLNNQLTPPANSIKFITENDTSSETDIPPGPWTLSLKYASEPMPSSLLTNEPDMLFLFNNGNPLTTDSSGFPGNTLTNFGSVSLQSSTPRDGSYYVTFDGSTQYFTIAKNAGGGGGNGNDENTNKDSTSAWFKTSTAPTGINKYILYRLEGGGQYYEISMIAGGKITFTFFINAIPGIVTCTSTKNYADGNWHHFVAGRPQGEQCNLFMDGGAPKGGESITFTTNGQNGDKFGAGLGNIYIARAPTVGSYFPGSLDDLMHWNKTPLTESQAGDLWTKNHGTSAHTLEVTISQTDKFGAIKYTVLPKQTAVLPYADNKGVTTNWSQYNITGSNFNLSNATDPNGIFHFIPNTRMLINVTWAAASQHPEAVPMYWRTDDITISNDRYTSYLQFPMPIPDFPFPSYFTYDHTKTLTFTVSNAGPNGIWITYSGTRAIFQSLTNATGSFAGLVTKGNSTQIDTNTDGAFMKVGAKLNLQFTTPTNIPSINGVGAQTITTGNYRMYVSVSGYDSAGNTLNRVFYIGPVKVT